MNVKGVTSPLSRGYNVSANVNVKGVTNHTVKGV